MTENLMTCAEVAAYLNMSEKTIRRWVLRRRIPFLKIHRSIRFRREAIEHFLHQGAVKAIAGGSEWIG